MKKVRNGFASIDPITHREIARLGGLAVSQNKEHMAEIGRKGGEESGRRRRERKLQQQSQPDGNYSDTEAGRAGKFLGLGHDYVPGDPGI